MLCGITFTKPQNGSSASCSSTDAVCVSSHKMELCILTFELGFWPSQELTQTTSRTIMHVHVTASHLSITLWTFYESLPPSQIAVSLGYSGTGFKINQQGHKTGLEIYSHSSTVIYPFLDLRPENTCLDPQFKSWLQKNTTYLGFIAYIWIFHSHSASKNLAPIQPLCWHNW